MHLPTFYWTALVAAVFSALSLKFLRIFHFISWSPVGWAGSIRYFDVRHPFVKWLALTVFLLLLYAVLYWLFTVTAGLPPAVTAVAAALILVCAAEWTVRPPNSLQSAVDAVSVPLLSLAAIIMRFVSGTAVFMETEMRKKAK